MNKDYYKILELDEEDKKLKGEDFKKKVKSNYKKLAKKYHPDKEGGDSEKFKELSEAYEILSDDEKRNNARQSGFTYNRSVLYGENITLRVKLTLEEIFTGVKKSYKYKRKINCDTCDGHGGSETKGCERCNGRGVVINVIRTQFGEFRNVESCNTCQGLGHTYKNVCVSCNGDGLRLIDDTIEFAIPSGVLDGMSFLTKNKGNSIKSGQPGDLIVTIIEDKHNKYIRVNNDLKMKLKLNYSQLVLGDKIEIDTIDGSRIRINIPEYSDVGNNLKIQNKGLKIFNSNNRGDLILNLDILIPKNIDDKTRELLTSLKIDNNSF